MPSLLLVVESLGIVMFAFVSLVAVMLGFELKVVELLLWQSVFAQQLSVNHRWVTLLSLYNTNNTFIKVLDFRSPKHSYNHPKVKTIDK